PNNGIEHENRLCRRSLSSRTRKSVHRDAGVLDLQTGKLTPPGYGTGGRWGFMEQDAVRRSCGPLGIHASDREREATGPVAIHIGSFEHGAVLVDQESHYGEAHLDRGSTRSDLDLECRAARMSRPPVAAFVQNGPQVQ